MTEYGGGSQSGEEEDERSTRVRVSARSAEEAVLLSVPVSRETFDAFETMAREQGKDEATLLRDVVGVAFAIHNELRHGGRIVLERRGGMQVELRFDWFVGAEGSSSSRLIRRIARRGT